jgi:ribosomal protein L40E
MTIAPILPEKTICDRCGAKVPYGTRKFVVTITQTDNPITRHYKMPDMLCPKCAAIKP